MDAVKKALKYPFKKLYAFGVFAIEARSTAWPGVSRFNRYILCTALFLNLVQIALTIPFAVRLGNMPEEALGCQLNSSIEGIRRYGTVLRPVTYADIRSNDSLSIGVGPSEGALLAAVLTTISVFVVLASALVCHLMRCGISNRGAALQAFWLLVALTASATSFVGLTVDADHVSTDANWCWVDHSFMVSLAAKRATRQRTYAGTCAIIGLEVVCALLYLLSAISAARLNRPQTRSQVIDHHNAIRLQGLSRRTNVGAEAAAGSEAQRNPFEDPQNVLDTSRTPNASGQPADPFTDANAGEDGGVKTSTSVVRETDGEEDPFGDAVAGQSVPVHVSNNTATSSSPALSTQNTSSIIDTVVDEGWELRSGPVDELSVIAEVDSKEERDA